VWPFAPTYIALGHHIYLFSLRLFVASSAFVLLLFSELPLQPPELWGMGLSGELRRLPRVARLASLHRASLESHPSRWRNPDLPAQNYELLSVIRLSIDGASSRGRPRFAGLFVA
jgi:hypothetical protein